MIEDVFFFLFHSADASLRCEAGTLHELNLSATKRVHMSVCASHISKTTDAINSGGKYCLHYPKSDSNLYPRTESLEVPWKLQLGLHSDGRPLRVDVNEALRPHWDIKTTHTYIQHKGSLGI